MTTKATLQRFTTELSPQVLANVASKHSLTNATAPPFYVTWLGPWPTFIFEPGSHVRPLASGITNSHCVEHSLPQVPCAPLLFPHFQGLGRKQQPCYFWFAFAAGLARAPLLCHYPQRDHSGQKHPRQHTTEVLCVCVPQYSIINVTGQATADNCAAEVQKVQKSSNGVEVVNNVTVLLRNGPSTITQRVFNSSTRAEGEF